MAGRNEKLNLIMKSLEDTIQLAVEFNYPNPDNIFDECKEIAFKLCKCEAESNQFHKAIDKANKDDSLEVFQSSLEEKKTPINDNAVRQSSQFKAFETQLAYLIENTPPSNLLTETGGDAQESEGIDLDESVAYSGRESQLINDIDPITKQQLRKPCRNRICNHIYGMNTIIELLQTNPKLRCPIVGCGNKNLIKINQLIPDEDLERKLQAQRNKLQSK